MRKTINRFRPIATALLVAGLVAGGCGKNKDDAKSSDKTAMAPAPAMARPMVADAMKAWHPEKTTPSRSRPRRPLFTIRRPALVAFFVPQNDNGLNLQPI